MRVVVERKLTQFVRFRDIPRLLSSPSLHIELHRGVVDAGRKTRTQVQKAVALQMAVTAGGYTANVVPNIRGIGRQSDLSFTIRGTGKGVRIQAYKGLRALSPRGRAAKAMNAGRSALDRGYVRSGVWNNPRTFQRSFAHGGEFFSLIPSAKGSSRLPEQFWTYGHKVNQPRSADGKFAAGGRSGFKVRRLYGPALGKELDKDQSLQTFLTFGPAELEIQVAKRVAKLMRF